MTEAVGRAVRAPDPFYRLDGTMVARPLAAHCSRIGLDSLVQSLTTGRCSAAASIAEVAAILGTHGRGAPRGAQGSCARPAGWLEAAARAMTDAMKQTGRRGGPDSTTRKLITLAKANRGPVTSAWRR